MAETLDVRSLRAAVEGAAAAFRCRRRLQPAGGEGDKVFPPTFAGAVYASEKRRLPGREEPADCVLLDSVQSQANRMELALQEAIDAGKITMPLLVVDFSEHYDPTLDKDAADKAGKLIDAVGKVTSLQVPHRLADAILRDSDLDGVAFRKSDRGQGPEPGQPRQRDAALRALSDGARLRHVGLDRSQGRSRPEVRAGDGVRDRRGGCGVER